MSILVLGARGRLARLLRGAAQVLGTPMRFAGRAPGRAGDLPLDPAALAPAEAAALLERAPDLVVSLWGPLPVTDPADRGHARLAGWACDLATACGCVRVAALSSAAVYPRRDDPTPFAEADTRSGPAPAPYGAAKRAMEAALADRPGAISLRLANVIGADQLADAVRTAGQDRPLTLDRFADGHGPRRAYLSPMTLVHVLTGLARHDPARLPGVLNVADSPRAHDMADILRCAGPGGGPVPFCWRHAPDDALPVHTLDTRALEAALPGLRPRFRRSAAHLVADWHAARDAA